MFLVTQLIGMFVVQAYTKSLILPYGMQPPEEVQKETTVFHILISFMIAIGLFFLLTKINAERFIRLWFFVVTILAIGMALNVIFYKFSFNFSQFIALIFAIPLAYIKIFKRDIYVHNITELLIYPGIAAVFVPLLSVFGIIILLLVISLYDIWAVWHSEFMQKMAKYQINNLKFFTGFFIPYAGKNEKMKIKQIKQKYANKSEKFLEGKFKQAKIKVSLAILGGGDVIFPIITAGVFYKVYDSIVPALIITAFAAIALTYLFLFSKKGKFYPAMPYLTIGMYLAMMLSWTLIGLGIID